MFKHFILTRFNLRSLGMNKTKNNAPIDEKWLEHRFYLFDRYCYPSVKNQSNKNFRWLVFFDPNTPDKYKEKIEKYKQDFKNFIPVFTDKEFLVSIKENINKFLNKETTHIITSCLDNDDAIHKDYINQIQTCFNNQIFCIVDVITGYTYKTGPLKELALRIKSNNQFISLIEVSNSFITTFSRPHFKWASEIRRVEIDMPLSLQIIHENNVANNMRWSFWYTNNYNILKDFSIIEEDKNPKFESKYIILKKNLIIISLILFNKKKIRKKTLIRIITPEKLYKTIKKVYSFFKNLSH
jgi:hypothetical protein